MRIKGLYLLPILFALTGCVTFSPESHSTGWGTSISIVKTWNSSAIENATISKSGLTEYKMSFTDNALIGRTPTNEQDIANYFKSGLDLIDDLFYSKEMNISLAPYSNGVYGGLQIGNIASKNSYFKFTFRTNVKNLVIKARPGFTYSEDEFTTHDVALGINNKGEIYKTISATKPSEITFEEYNFICDPTSEIEIYTTNANVVISEISYWA